MDVLLTRKIFEEAKNKEYSSLLDIACDLSCFVIFGLFFVLVIFVILIEV